MGEVKVQEEEVEAKEVYNRKDVNFNKAATLDTLHLVEERLNEAGYGGQLSVFLDPADHPALHGSVECANENLYTLDISTSPPPAGYTYLSIEYRTQFDWDSIPNELQEIIDITKDCLEQKTS